MTASETPSKHAPSYYAATAKGDQPRSSLAGSVRADVCVIGGGYTGISTALHLAERGYSVIVLEAERIGWGASGRNGGQLHSGQRRDQNWLESHVGKEHARRFWLLAEEAKALVKDRIARHTIDCDWIDGLIHAVHKPGWLAEEQAYAEHLARDYDYHDITLLDRDQLATAICTDVYYGGYRDAGGGHLHPLNFALGMARAAEEAGARLFETSRVTSISQGSPAIISTDAGEVTADTVVLAANGYMKGLEPQSEARVMPLNNFILTSEPLDEERAAALIPGMEAVSDSRFVVNYWRMTKDRRMLFGGGEKYTHAFPRDIAGFVRRHMLKTYPQLADVKIDYAWGGTLALSRQRMPYMRRPRPNVYIATAYSGHGVAIANLAGKILSEAISGDMERFDTYASLSTPAFPGGTLLRWPILALAMSWYALRDRL